MLSSIAGNSNPSYGAAEMEMIRSDIFGPKFRTLNHRFTDYADDGREVPGFQCLHYLLRTNSCGGGLLHCGQSGFLYFQGICLEAFFFLPPIWQPTSR